MRKKSNQYSQLEDMMVSIDTAASLLGYKTYNYSNRLELCEENKKVKSIHLKKTYKGEAILTVHEGELRQCSYISTQQNKPFYLRSELSDKARTIMKFKDQVGYLQEVLNSL